MTVNELVRLLMQLLFISLGFVTIVDYLIYRGQIRRDIALLFGCLAFLFLAQIITSTGDPQYQWVGLIGVMALVTQPYLLLRLVRYFRSVPTLYMRMAGLGMVVIWIALAMSEAFTESSALIVLLAIIAYFVTVNSYAAAAFVRGVLITSGVVRQRLRFAAAGTAFVAATLLTIAFITFVPDLSEIFSSLDLILAMAAGMSYYIGFAPPRWLRRAWQLNELRNFLLLMNTRPVHERLQFASSQHELCQHAKQAVGGKIAVIVHESDNENGWELRTPPEQEIPEADLIAYQGIFRQVWDKRTPIALTASDRLRADERQLLKTFTAECVLIAPIATAERVWGLLLVFLEHNSLFPADDLELVTLLAQQSAVVLENGALLEELHRYSAELEQRVEERTRELHESKEEYQRIVETAQEGILVTDAEHKTSYVNTRLAEMLGYTVDELLDAPPSEFLDGDKFPLTLANSEQQNGFGERTELKLRNKDGDDLWVLCSVTPLTDQQGQYLGALAMLTDITALKKAEEEVLKLNAELELRIEERTAQLEATNKELEAFSYSVSHDLRAPLRSIDGFSQALMEDYADELNDEARSYLKRVRNAAQRMAELIDDLLKLSRITRAELQRKEVDLGELSQAIVAELRNSHPERQVELVVHDDLITNGDPHLLRIALENLIGNAWKFTSKKEKTRIEVGKTIQGTQCVYFVRDDGVGFDMTYADKLFGAFQRLHNITDYEGTGIGLATVSRIIHRHGGRVWAEGAVGQGATFYFSI